MTPREHDAISFYRAYWAQHGYAPCYDEVASALNLKAKSGVHRLVVQLERLGELERVPARRRGVRPVIHRCPNCGISL